MAAPALGPGLTEAAAGSVLRAPWSVAALLLAAGDALAARFGAVHVRGELSGFTRAASGHCYFSLKDADGATALLRCAMFRRAAVQLDFAPADGQQVELRGRIGVYEARGELQLVVEGMRRVGTGALYEEFLRLRARLQAEGLFDASRKRALPAMPRRLGVVTSPGAAALHDVLTALRRRAPQVAVVIYPTLVQGAEAPPAIAAALALANQRAEVEALLLVRGGGSLEDLWAFNDERVVRALVASRLPTVCGVGHETDLTLADLAADLRAPTPTAAAELAAPPQQALLDDLAGRARALARSAQRLLQTHEQRVDRAALRLGVPAARVQAQQQGLQALAARLQRAPLLALKPPARELQHLRQRWHRAGQVWLAAQAHGLDSQQAALQALDPARVLHRGYAWVEDERGQAVLSAQALAPGQRVRAVWSDGAAQAQIESVEPPPAAP